MRAWIILCCCFAMTVTIATAPSWDPSNLSEWQVDPKYPPNQTETWTYGIEMDGWMMAHDALRGEVFDFQNALDRFTEETLLDSDEITVNAIYRWWSGHIKHVRSHHRNEDKIVQNFVHKRFIYPEFMHTDHIKIEEHMERISKLLRILTNRETMATLDRRKLVQQFIEAWKEYMADLLIHLEMEEVVGISLTRAYFNPKEVRGLTRRLAMTGPRVETGAIVHYVGEAKVKMAMEMQQVPLIGVTWALVLNPRYRYYRKHMLAHLDVIGKRAT